MNEWINKFRSLYGSAMNVEISNSLSTMVLGEEMSSGKTPKQLYFNLQPMLISAVIDQCERSKMLLSYYQRDRSSVIIDCQWLLCLCRQEWTIHTISRVCEHCQTGKRQKRQTRRWANVIRLLNETSNLKFSRKQKKIGVVSCSETTHSSCFMQLLMSWLYFSSVSLSK